MAFCMLMTAHWALIGLFWIQIALGSIHNEPIQMCGSPSPSSHDEDLFMPDVGSESSLSIDFRPNVSNVICVRSFVAPEGFGFYFKMQRRPKGANAVDKRMQKPQKAPVVTSNPNQTCPIHVYTSNDPLMPPWRVDPCKLSQSTITEEPDRLLPGRVRLVWNHHQQDPGYQVVLTVIGQGFLCENESKFACFKYDFVPILCISSDLVCDRIKQCPQITGAGAFNDEAPALCIPKIHQTHTDDVSIWHKLSIGLLKNMLNMGEPAQAPVSPFNFPTSMAEMPPPAPPRPVSPPSVTRGLARYGPWGYLMLAMLLCGAALLFCGLWECCCRRQKPEREDSLSSLDIPSSPSLSHRLRHSAGQGATAPPNYEEIDPPPSYTTLFPLNKSASSSTSSNEAGAPTDENLSSLITTDASSSPTPEGSNDSTTAFSVRDSQS